MSQLDFNMLPEDCASTICSLTSPEDACRLSMVSSSFRSAAGSDLVWERFLPSDYRDILARTLKPLKFSSKKELFFLFSESILLDGGKQVSPLSVMLNHSGKVLTYITSAWGSRRNEFMGYLEIIKRKFVKEFMQSNRFVSS